MFQRLLKPLVFTLSLLPLVYLAFASVSDGLGANPIEVITHFTGDWTLRFLLLTLAITPIRGWTGWHWLIKIRRMLGLYAFFYAVLHFLTWLVLDQFFDWSGIIEDVVKRPYITIGFSAFVMLIPLAATSTNAMIRRLGSKWRKLHRLVYVIGIFGVVHYLWLVKADLLEPFIYTLILALLLGSRVMKAGFGRKSTET